MSKKSKISNILVVTATMFLTTGVSAEDSDSGFLDDYSKLEPIAGTNARVYNAPGAFESFKNYKAVMIDQPEFIIAADSKYRGGKPKDQWQNCEAKLPE